MSDAAGKTKPGKPAAKDAGGKQQQEAKGAKQQQRAEKPPPVASNGNGSNGSQAEDVENQTVTDMLRSHEKELLAVAADLISKTGRYDAELRQLTDKLEAASRRLLQLERRFPTLVLWRIGNFAENFKLARAGRGSLMESQPYYLSRQGYRMVISIGLYGDGNARGSHVSMYVSLCKGEFDGSLIWPFASCVYLSVLDQTEDQQPRRHLSKVIVPRVCRENLPFLGRPRAERNPRFGFEQFADLNQLLRSDRQYVLNDAVYVKLETPCEDLRWT